MTVRCEWTGDWNDIDDIMVKYHDEEWGEPKHDDRRLFEDLVLDGAQAGLSWSTILNKRENYREAFDNFDPAKVAAYDEAKIEELLQNPGIVRNRQKVNSAVKNAKAFLKIQEEFGSFDAYIWGFVDGKPIQNERKSMSELPAKTELSEGISKDLKIRGFNFVGPTIIYAFMQAVGLVNDHTIDCFRYREIAAMR
ncbi:MAG TPA: DNA-3-methyladenine glycosylase I [candidate division Zixibacteria bacterium]|nr:DNA-3-methyladenine glycosylase I [candidate division Zixibacteria bacterium]